MEKYVKNNRKRNVRTFGSAVPSFANKPALLEILVRWYQAQDVLQQLVGQIVDFTLHFARSNDHEGATKIACTSRETLRFLISTSEWIKVYS